MSKTRVHWIAFVALMFMLLSLAGCKKASEPPVTLARESTAETITLVPTFSVKWKLASYVHDVPHIGTFELKSAKGTVSGKYSYWSDEKNERNYSFEAQSGEKWSARMDAHGTITDQNGNVWRQQKAAAVAVIKHDLKTY